MPCTSDYGQAGPARHDIEVYRGDTFTMVIPMTDDLGEPVDIEGCSYAATLKQTREAVSAIAFAVTVDEPTATVTLLLTPTQTSDEVPRRGVWDLQETCGSLVTTLIAGEVRAIDGVT